MATKTVDMVVSPPATHYVGDGFRVHNFIPSMYGLTMKRMDPFIMMDYNSPFYFGPTDTARGVGVHPHRGFETVTIAYQGKVAHHDSHGGGGVIAEGDVQWMTAASGVLHKEYHEKNFSKEGGIFQMVQLWINLPAKYKMSPPKYQAISNSSIPKYQLSENGGEIEVIAGEYNGIKGSAFTFSPINMYNVKMNAGATANFSTPANYNTCLLVVKGAVTVNGENKVPVDNFVLMHRDGEDFTITADEESIVLVLSGEPINEPIAAHGPFVMNTWEELAEAFNDYNAGKFGHLED